MPANREITTCSRCRAFKVRCDRKKPTCTRCMHADVECSLQQDSSPDARTSQSPSGESIGDATPATTPTDSVSDGLPVSGERLVQQLADKKSSSGVTRKKRRRACLSCTRCHRLKVKCDKGQPCSRCRLSGFGRHCEYSHRIEPDPDGVVSSHSFLIPPATPGRIMSAWKSHPRGSSHWRDLTTKVEYLAKLVSPAFHSAAAEISHINSISYECHTEFNLPVNYPFNSPGASRYSQLPNIMSLLLHHRFSWGPFFEEYCRVFQTVHPIVNVSEMQNMIGMTPVELQEVEVSLLGEFCAVLGLGAVSSTKDFELSTELFLAAEACLAQTPFMIRPSLNTLRTMCMMIIAKQMANATCWTIDGCWTLLGLITRQAGSIGLHRELGSVYDSGEDAYKQWKDGQVLWLTIIYFNIQVSAVSGMPPFIYPNECVDMVGTFPWMLEGTEPNERIWHTAINNSCQTLIEVLNRINSDRNRPSYNETLDYNTKIRRLMSLLDTHDMQPTLRITLDVFFRRVLLALHRRYALDYEGPSRYVVSYWTSLECSLAILVHHRELGDADARPHGSEMIKRFFMLDFFGAALTACIHLLRQDAPLADGMAIPPRQTIVETLEACAELWSKEKNKSICFRAACRMLESVLNLLTKKVLIDV